MRMSIAPRAARRIAAALALLVTTSAEAAEEVNIYSYREPPLMAPLLQAFTQRTGIKANLLYAAQGLEDRIKAEGANSPADVLLTADVSRLVEAKDAGITQPIGSATIAAAIPAPYRDPADHWTGLSMRARAIYAANDRVTDTAIRYEDLADPKWKGRICARSGQHPYNTALLAAMIAHLGPAKAEAWIRGVKANLARKPAGGDREQMRDVAAGQCDIAIANTYYMALMQTDTAKPEQKKWAAAVRIVLPNAADRGSHVNIAGAVVARYAPHKANAVKLIEFLASDEGQKLYADMVFEYPLKTGVAPAAIVRGWGALKPDSLPVTEIARHRKAASEMMDKVDFDAGP